MWTRATFKNSIHPPVIGMVHLPPLPGSPGWNQDWEDLESQALAAAEALVAGGVGAVMIENYHDVPFFPGPVPTVTVAALAVLVKEVRRAHPQLSLGVNVLRNDAEAALAIAAVAGAQFIRSNVHAGSVLTDQGLISGRAHWTLRRRRELGAPVGILADLRVKHGQPVGQRPLAEEAVDLRRRSLADGLILTGSATGREADPRELSRVRQALPDCPLLVGSGVTPQNLATYTDWADGFIVGTWFQDPNPVGPNRVISSRASELIAALAAVDVPEGKESP
jgi:membrane complex biogenesis BtpA family protein